MRLRTAATLVATAALLVGAGVVAAVAAPGVAIAVQHTSDVLVPAGTPMIPPTPAPSLPAASASPAASERSSAADTGSLIGAAGSVVLTRAELHAWVAARPFFGEDPANDRVWEEQAWLDIRCMARKGFLDDPTNPALAQREPSEEDGLSASEVAAYSAALWGPPTDEPYDWRTAGCHGRSVHLTGQDDAH